MSLGYASPTPVVVKNSRSTNHKAQATAHAAHFAATPALAPQGTFAFVIFVFFELSPTAREIAFMPTTSRFFRFKTTQDQRQRCSLSLHAWPSGSGSPSSARPPPGLGARRGASRRDSPVARRGPRRPGPGCGRPRPAASGLRLHRMISTHTHHIRPAGTPLYTLASATPQWRTYHSHHRRSP